MTEIVSESRTSSNGHFAHLRHSPVRQQKFLRLAGIAMAVGLGLIAAFSGTALGAGLTVTSLFGVVTWHLVAWERRRWGVIGVGSPLSLTAASWFVFFGLLGLGAHDDASANPLLGYDSWWIVRAVFVVLSSLVLLAVGYAVATRGTKAIANQYRDASVRYGGVILILLIGWAARIYLFASGQFGYISLGEVSSGLGNRAIQSAGNLLILGLVILTIAAWSPSRLAGLPPGHAKWLLALNVVPLVLTAAASGLKGQLITDLTPAAVAFVMLRGKVPWRAVAVAVVYLMVVTPGIQDYRDDLNSGAIAADERSGIGNAVFNAGSRVLTGWMSAQPADHAVRLWDHVTREYSTMSRNLAVILYRTPQEVPHLGNERLFSEPLFFLPGSVLGRQDFNVYVYTNTVYLEGPATSASPPTQPGDFYMSGGWVSVIIGQIIVGLFLGLVWRMLVIARRSMSSVAVYAVVAALFATAGIEWGTLSRDLLQTTIVLFPISMMLFRPASSPVRKNDGL